jgi:hypothetical protein
MAPKESDQMRIPIVISIAVAISMIALTSGCSKSIQQTIEKAKGSAQEEQRVKVQAEEDAQLDYLDEWAAFRSEAEQQIIANAKNIDSLKTAITAAGGKMQTVTLDELTRKNQALLKKLDGYQDEGKVNWDAFKNEFAHDQKQLDMTLKVILTKL